jgi:hypothetical protein
MGEVLGRSACVATLAEKDSWRELLIYARFIAKSGRNAGSGPGVLAPQQDFTMGAWVDRRYDDDNEAEAIKRGIGRRLYIWGTVTYDDVFGEQRYTNFAQNIFGWRFQTEANGYWGTTSIDTMMLPRSAGLSSHFTP